LLKSSKSKKPLRETLNSVVREYCAPDDRFQLNVLLFHAEYLGDPGTVAFANEACATFPTVKFPLLSWTATPVFFDPTLRRVIELDMDEGVIKLILRRWPERLYWDAEMQGRIVKDLRAKVLLGKKN
jgi:hypothetical protein